MLSLLQACSKYRPACCKAGSGPARRPHVHRRVSRGHVSSPSASPCMVERLSFDPGLVLLNQAGPACREGVEPPHRPLSFGGRRPPALLLPAPSQHPLLSANTDAPAPSPLDAPAPPPLGAAVQPLSQPPALRV